MTINPPIDIHDLVTHVCCSTSEGICVDWRYTRSVQKFEFYVTFSSTDHPMWFSREELILKKKYESKD